MDTLTHLFCLLVFTAIASARSTNIGGQLKSAPIFLDSNGMYSVNVDVGTPPQTLRVALSHLQDPVLASTACGELCSGRTLYNAATSTTQSTSNDGKNLNSPFGNFTGSQTVTDQTETAGTKKSATWNLATSAQLPSGTSFVGLLPVTGSNFLSLETLASTAPNKSFSINFARDDQHVGDGRLWIGATDPTVTLSSITFFDVLKFQGFSMIRFAEGAIGDQKLNCKVGPKTDCDATLNLASNFSTLGRNIDDIATSLGLTKRSNKYVVDCDRINQLPNVALKVNNAQLTFTPNQYVVKNNNGGTQECLFGFVSSNFKDFRLGLNLLRHIYLVFRETSEGGDNKLQMGFYNVN